MPAHIRNANGLRMAGFLLVAFALLPSTVEGQIKTSKSKSCSRCFKQIPLSSKVGDKCPHCGVRWGGEKSFTGVTPFQPSSPSPSSNTSSIPAIPVLHLFLIIVAIGIPIGATLFASRKSAFLRKNGKLILILFLILLPILLVVSYSVFLDWIEGRNMTFS